MALINRWLYRATIVWDEGNVSKSTARGSVDSASSPHIITPVEAIAIMYKGQWTRSPGESDIEHDEWLEWTNGLWKFNGESRPWENQPAAFPEELPRRLIKLLSCRHDLVADPFGGSFTTAVAAAKLGRRFVGFDVDPGAVAGGERRLASLARSSGGGERRMTAAARVSHAVSAETDPQRVSPPRSRSGRGRRRHTGSVAAFVCLTARGRSRTLAASRIGVAERLVRAPAAACR
jgi:hypothetical protein